MGWTGIGWYPPAVEDEAIGLYLLYPTDETWRDGDRTVSCIATTATPSTGSLRR